MKKTLLYFEELECPLSKTLFAREDLNIIEVAQALKELMDIEGYNMADVSRVTGKSLSGVSNTMRLLKLPTKIQEQVLDGKLVEGQARALLAIENEEEQLKLADKIIEKKLTVKAARFTKTAGEKIEALGGKIEVI